MNNLPVIVALTYIIYNFARSTLYQQLMLKLLLFTLGLICAVAAAFGQRKDTVVTYYRYYGNIARPIPSIDSADFVQFIGPRDTENDGLCSVTEYYIDGKRKFVGRGDDAYMRKFGWKAPVLQGSAIEYYPNGRKKNILTYKDGHLEGMCTEYFPNGILYCIKIFPQNNVGMIKLVECHDLKGNLMAHDGNGHWIHYQENFDAAIAEGEVSDGLMTGEWTGVTPDSNAIKFIYTYKKSVIVNAKSYDAEGHMYVFKDEIAGPAYTGSLYSLNDFFRRKLKLNHEQYPESNPLKLEFTIEPDKHITHIVLEGTMDEELKKTVANMVLSDNKWQPMKYFGKPVPTQMEIILNQYSGYKFPHMSSSIHIALSKKFLELINNQKT